jgi:hypothetical protein
MAFEIGTPAITAICWTASMPSSPLTPESGRRGPAVAGSAALDDGRRPERAHPQAPGLAVAEEIYCGIRAYENATACYYIWDLNGFIGFNPANDFYAQPGAISGWLADDVALEHGDPVLVRGPTAGVPWWWRMISTATRAAQPGFVLPYATPGQYPYPLLVGGSMTGQRGPQLQRDLAQPPPFRRPGRGWAEQRQHRLHAARPLGRLAAVPEPRLLVVRVSL